MTNRGEIIRANHAVIREAARRGSVNLLLESLGSLKWAYKKWNRMKTSRQFTVHLFIRRELLVVNGGYIVPLGFQGEDYLAIRLHKMDLEDEDCDNLASLVQQKFNLKGPLPGLYYDKKEIYIAQNDGYEVGIQVK